METMDDPSQQLQSDIRTSLQRSLASRRPILHHLNADTSWLLQVPRPESAVRNGSRFYFNILIDPWFSGGQSDVASWFSQQFHATPSAVSNVADLEELMRGIEALADDLRPSSNRKTSRGAAVSSGDETYIDVVAVSHEFTDHCHRETLTEINRDVPVYAIKEAAKLITGWQHFRTIITVDSFGAHGHTDWRSTSIPPLPDWIGISRLLQSDDVLNYHSALLITFNIKNHSGTAVAPTGRKGRNGTLRSNHTGLEHGDDDEGAEAIVYTPHGIHSGDLNLIPTASPPVRTLAFLHGLHNVRVGTASGRTALQSNLGAHNGLKAQRLLSAKYWIGTHDEIKTGGGLVAWFLQRKVISLKEALEEEKQAKKKALVGGSGPNEVESETLDAFEGTNWLELRNGESRVLM